MIQKDKFDDEIIAIEKEIIDYLMSYSLFIGQKHTSTIIKIYFITRKSLTQEKLQELTSFSRGTISQEIKQLINMKLIEKSEISETGEITYTMKSPVIAFIHSFSDLTNNISRFATMINITKDDIEREKETIKDLHGFDKVYQLVNALSNAIPLSLELIQLINNELINYQIE